MKFRYGITPGWLAASGLLLTASFNAAAASTGFNVHSVCKSVEAVRDRGSVAAIISTHCLVDIRLDNIKDIMKERIMAGDTSPFLPPVFRGAASSLFVLPPVPGGGIGAGTDLQQEFSAPFTALNLGMRAFTGGQDIVLELGMPPPWEAIPAFPDNRDYLLLTSLWMESLNAVPQAVVPLPPAVGLMTGGLLMLAGSGLLMNGKKRP